MCYKFALHSRQMNNYRGLQTLELLLDFAEFRNKQSYFMPLDTVMFLKEIPVVGILEYAQSPDMDV